MVQATYAYIVFISFPYRSKLFLDVYTLNSSYDGVANVIFRQFFCIAMLFAGIHGEGVSYMQHRGRILGHNWDKSLKSFPPCYSQSPLLRILPSPHPLPRAKWFETGL